MQISLIQLKITNFKGITSLVTPLNQFQTFIYGDNATGKTTIVDAFLWLFFGKNSEGVSQFEVKRLDSNNKFIPNIESEVEAIVHIDGKEIAIRKVLRQKWVKRRGELNSNYSGDENIYFWNDVPLKESEFRVKVAGIIDENLFRLITNPLYFNSLKWQDRRNTLINIAGEITNSDVFDLCVTVANKTQMGILINELNRGKTIDEFKKELAVKKKKVKDEAEGLPDRIDEVMRGLPEEIDFVSLKDKLEAFQLQLTKIDNQLNDALLAESEQNKANAETLKDYNQKVQGRQQAIFRIKNQLQQLEFDAKQKAGESGIKLRAKANSLSSQINDITADINRYKNSLTQLDGYLKAKTDELEQLRATYVSEDEKVFEFDEQSCVCPTCKQNLPTDEIEASKQQLLVNFNQNKIKTLDHIQQKAGVTKQEIETLNTRIANAKVAIKDKETELENAKKELAQVTEDLNKPSQSIDDAVKEILATNADYTALQTNLKELEDVVLIEPTFDKTTNSSNDFLKSEKAQLNADIQKINIQLAQEETLTKGKNRIQELQQQESKLAEELVELEGTEFAIQEFTKAKIDAIERRINGKFKTVKFKMFNQQINGGESECCDTLVNSNGSFVPFADANNAAKINAGIDIINTLCTHYDIYAPIFIDNRESVTKLIDCSSQVINLIVSEQDKKLRIA